MSESAVDIHGSFHVDDLNLWHRGGCRAGREAAQGIFSEISVVARFDGWSRGTEENDGVF